MKEDISLWVEGLSGALFVDDFKAQIEDIGFGGYRRVSSSSVDIDDNPKICE